MTALDERDFAPLLTVPELVVALKAIANEYDRDHPRRWILTDAAAIIEREVLHRDVPRRREITTAP